MLDTRNNFREIIRGVTNVKQCTFIVAIGSEENHIADCRFFNIFAD
jgi:hypothetical protein